MKYNRYIFTAIIAAILFGAVSCDDIKELSVTSPKFTINLPNNVTAGNVYNDTLTCVNLSNGISEKIPASQIDEIQNGFYDIFYKAEVKTDAGTSGKLKGSLENVIIDNKHKSFTIDVHLLLDKNDFIIEEIFFTGTLRESGKQYYGDSYVKIYNNTDHVLYADGIAFLESKFTSTQKYDYKPDIRKDTMTVHAIYVIPGSGKEHPVQPGESLLLCDTGINHRVANPNSIDLSNADFEWYDVSSTPSHMDIDSEFVDNLDKWYCYTLSFFVLHNRGFRSYAIGRIPVNKEKYLNDYLYSYDYIVTGPSGNYPMTGSAYKFPNDWIVDGVNCSVEAERQWNLLPPTIDSGWTHCGTIDKDQNRYFKSVRRKMIGLDEKGNRILQDTDNSTDDFNTECIPSVIEQQHSSVNAEGDKAVKITYDGIIEVK